MKTKSAEELLADAKTLIEREGVSFALRCHYEDGSFDDLLDAALRDWCVKNNLNPGSN